MKKFLLCLFAVLSITLCVCSGCAGRIPEKPADTSLEFWIAEDVSSVDFSDYYARGGVFGAHEYYGKGYRPAEISEGNEDVLPQHYVLYTVGGYPDTSDDWNYIIQIQITDPEVLVYGLTCDSQLEEFDKTMKEHGYIISENSVGTMHTATSGKVRINLFSNGEQNSISISVDVTNRWGIHY